MYLYDFEKKVLSTINYQRDGFMTISHQGGAPNYFPNSFKGPVENPSVKDPSFPIYGVVDRFTPVDEDNFSQVTTFWRDVLKPNERTRTVNNLVDSLKRASPFIIERAISNFSQVDEDLGRRLLQGLQNVVTSIL